MQKARLSKVQSSMCDYWGQQERDYGGGVVMKAYYKAIIPRKIHELWWIHF